MRRHRCEVKHSYYGGGRMKERTPCGFMDGGLVEIPSAINKRRENALKNTSVQMIHRYELLKIGFAARKLSGP